MPNRNDTGWTENRTERLKAMWRDGLSASQIAAELGGVSRCAVIGKVHRLGLTGRANNPPGGPKPRAKAVRDAPFRPPPQMPAKPPRLTSEPPPQPIEAPAVIPMGQRCTLMELTVGKCRWPIGDPQHKDNFFFCGGRAVEGLPYCGYHERIAYRPAAERRREREPPSREVMFSTRRRRAA